MPCGKTRLPQCRVRAWNHVAARFSRNKVRKNSWQIQKWCEAGSMKKSAIEIIRKPSGALALRRGPHVEDHRRTE